MNPTPRLSSLLLLSFVFFILAGCSSVQQAAAPATSEEPPQAVSQIQQLESSAIMIDAVRQKTLGNWAQAALMFYEAGKKDPLNDAAHFELSKIHAMQGEFEDALTYARKAVEINPENVYYQFLLADVLMLSDRMEDALSVYEAMAQKHPENVDYNFRLVNAYMQAEEYQQALGVLDHIETLTGYVEEIIFQKQKILMEMGDYERAIVETQKLLQAFPHESMLYEQLGRLYNETDQPEKAFDIYEKLLVADPGNPMGFLLMADYYQNQGDSAQAFVYLRDAFRSPELDTESKGQILYTFYLLSQEDEKYLDQAIELCSILIEVHPDDAESYLIYGDFLVRKDQVSEAREVFLKGVALDPSTVEVWQQILILDSMLEDFESMKLHSEQALEYFFEHPILFLFNGIANVSLENYKEAASSLEMGLEMVASDQEMEEQFLTMLGDVHHYLEDHPRSDAFYQQALDVNPENATALNNYSYHLAQRKVRLKEAEVMARKAIELEEGNPAFLDTYGWILYQLERYEEARQWIEKSIQADQQPGGGVLEHYGDVLFKLGDVEQAVEYWNKALKAGDGSSLLDRKVKNRTLYE
ncbi:MAG: tetratricopeptide repeat protein [Bacteroidales bacterium]